MDGETRGRRRAYTGDILGYLLGGGLGGGLETNFIYTLASTRHQKHEEHASAPPQRSCTHTSQSDVVGLNHRLLTPRFGSAHARGLFIY